MSLKANPSEITEGGLVTLELDQPAEIQGVKYEFEWKVEEGFLQETAEEQKETNIVHWDTTGLRAGAYKAIVIATPVSPTGPDSPVGPPSPNIQTVEEETRIVVKARPLARGDIQPITLGRTSHVATDDVALWVVIRKSSEALSFRNYDLFIRMLLCGEDISKNELVEAQITDEIKKNVKAEFEERLKGKRFLPYFDVDAYRLLKVATEAFVMVNCGVALENYPFSPEDLRDLVDRTNVVRRDNRPVDLNVLWKQYLNTVNGTSVQTIPYLEIIKERLGEVPIKTRLFSADNGGDSAERCYGILRAKLTNPCMLELIWSYWHEEGMLCQTMKAISKRFQNIRGTKSKDPLSGFELDPLRPLNNLLWGYIQDEQHRLSVLRRAYEYDHHYGITLEGKAVANLQPADSRSKFLEAFHTLLHLCSLFYQQEDDATIVADGFPVLNALKEVHFLLSEGAHNQYGDMPSTSRMEMLMEEWLLARPEIRSFLSSRIMVAYPEPWMDAVDVMKKLQGWSDSSVLHFRNLAVFGEQILLSIRLGAWNDVHNSNQAANWAKFWREPILSYMHAYRAVTGVGLSADTTADRIDSTMPSILLKNRLLKQKVS